MVRGHSVRGLPERAGRMLQIETRYGKQTNKKQEEKESVEQSRKKLISTDL